MSADHLTILRIIAFVERHGYAVLFFWILAEQSALPAPSIPLLLAAGSLVRTGRMHLLAAIACCVAGALIADFVWFQVGRHNGRRVLRLLCRLSLEPDSCVRQTENAFLKYGIRVLLISKFIPGLNAVAAPLAGHSKTSSWQFALYDSLGAAIWSGAYLSLGYVFSDQLESVLAYASNMGSTFLALAAAAFLLWICAKFIQRRRFLRQLDGARIAPEELRDRLNAGEKLFVVDLRGGLEERATTIPGAVRISPDDLASRHHEIPRDRDIILFCS